MPTKSTTKAKKASKKTSSKKAQSKKTTSKKKTSAVSNLKKAVEKNTPKTSAASNKKAVTRKSVQKTAQAIRDAAKKMGQKSAKPSNKKVSKSTEVDFKVGDRAVYPAHGVGVIERIDNKEISGVVVSFYVMRILDNDMMVMIPKSNAKHAGLREIIPSRRVGKVFKVFEDQKEVKIDTTTWNRRYRDYMEKIKTGSVLEIAQVMRDLYTLKKTKTLSFGERKMLDTARSLLVKELALAKGVEENEIEATIASYFQ